MKMTFSIAALMAVMSILANGQAVVRPAVSAQPNASTTWTTDPFIAVKESATYELGTGTTTINTNVTVPRSVTIKFLPGSVLSVNKGFTLTINGGIEAPSSRIFGGPGVIVIGNKTTTISPEWWGDVADDTLDDTLAIQAALDSAPAGGMVQLTSGVHIVSNITISRPLTLRAENFGAQLRAAPGAKGYLINVIANSILDRDGYLEGIRLTGFSMNGNKRTPDVGAIKMQSVEHFLIDHLNIEDFNREALNLYSNVREGSFEDLWFRFVGNADSNYPAINLTESLTTTGDAHNFLNFSRIYSALTMGDHILIDTVAGKQLLGHPIVARDITFSDLVTHGIPPELDGIPYKFTAAQKASGRIVIRSAGNIKFSNATLRLAGTGQPYVYVRAGSHSVQPHKITFDLVDTSGRYAYTGDQTGIKVDVGDVHLSNSNIDGPLTSIDAAPGSEVFMDTATRLYPANSSLKVASNARMPVTLPMDLTVTQGLRLIDDQQESLYFRLHNTKPGGHSYNISAGAAGDGNSAGGFYVYDLTTNRLLFQLNADGKMIVAKAMSSGSVRLKYADAVATDANLGNFFKIAATDTKTFTISEPVNATDGQILTYQIENSTGGIMGEIRWGSHFRLAGGVFTNPAAGKLRTISFQFNGSDFVELSRSDGDL